MKYFKLTQKTKIHLGIKLFQIEATIDFKDIKKGDKGGWIEKENNLSGNAWVYGNAWGKSPLQIQGTRHFINECKKGNLKIGCFDLPIKEWKERYMKIGKENEYTDKEIKEYKLYIDLAEKLSKLS